MFCPPPRNCRWSSLARIFPRSPPMSWKRASRGLPKKSSAAKQQSPSAMPPNPWPRISSSAENTYVNWLYAHPERRALRQFLLFTNHIALTLDQGLLASRRPEIRNARMRHDEVDNVHIGLTQMSFSGSALFRRTFDEGMALVEETARYLDGPGRADARTLSRKGAILYAGESMRLTTRMMQAASWLLVQRAVNDGDMEADQAASR